MIKKETLLDHTYLEENTLKVASIDSLKLRIPFEEVKLIKTDLDDNWKYLNDSTGEIDEKEYLKRAYWSRAKGIATKYAVEHQTIEGGHIRKYLVILVSSKVLKELYFYGISKKTIFHLLKEINNQNVVNLEMYQLLQAECVDIDFKVDYEMTIHEFEGLIELSKHMTIPKQRLKTGYQVFLGKGNKGIAWGTRQTQSPKTNPFWKHYHKGLELKEKSYEFTDEYLTDQVFENRCRTEFTIKNRQHLNAVFGSPQSDLNYLINLPQDKLFAALNMCIDAHLYRPDGYKPIEERTYKNPADTIISNLIQVAIMSKFSETHIIEIALNGITDKHRRTRQKKRVRFLIRQLVHQHPSTQNQLAKNKAGHELYKWLTDEGKDNRSVSTELTQQLLFYKTMYD